MAVALERLSFADYLQYDNGTDVRYELVAGELIPMSLGTGLHAEIMHLLEKQFEAAIATRKLPWVARKGAIGIQSPQRGRWDTVRIPDVVVLPQQQWQEIRSREAVILLSEPPPSWWLKWQVPRPPARTIGPSGQNMQSSILPSIGLSIH
nr:Uma2 family endonuclease [Synechococcus sp. PCC 7336]